MTGPLANLYVFLNQGTAVLNINLVGPMNLVKYGGGTLTLDPISSNTYTGSTYIQTGALILEAGAGLVAVPGNLILNNSTVTYGAATELEPATATVNSTSVTGLTSTAGFVVGETVTGTNIPSGTTVAAITSGTSLTLSQPATATGPTTLTISGALNAGQIASTSNITLNGTSTFTLPVFTTPVSNTFSSINFANTGGSSNPTFSLGTPTAQDQVILTGGATSNPGGSAYTISAQNDNFGFTPTISTGSATLSYLEFTNTAPVINTLGIGDQISPGVYDTGPPRSLWRSPRRSHTPAGRSPRRAVAPWFSPEPTTSRPV